LQDFNPVSYVTIDGDEDYHHSQTSKHRGSFEKKDCYIPDLTHRNKYFTQDLVKEVKREANLQRSRPQHVKVCSEIHESLSIY